MVTVHQTQHFNAAHKLYNPNWSDEKNAEIFGPCANENWHGHNFELITSVTGEVNPETGFLIDPVELSELVNSEVIEKVDHKNLNLDVPFMTGQLGSCENLIVAFWKLLQPRISEISSLARLSRLRRYETPRNFVDYYGD